MSIRLVLALAAIAAALLSLLGVWEPAKMLALGLIAAGLALVL